MFNFLIKKKNTGVSDQWFTGKYDKNMKTIRVISEDDAGNIEIIICLDDVSSVVSRRKFINPYLSANSHTQSERNFAKYESRLYIYRI